MAVSKNLSDSDDVFAILSQPAFIARIDKLATQQNALEKTKAEAIGAQKKNNELLTEMEKQRKAISEAASQLKDKERELANKEDALRQVNEALTKEKAAIEAVRQPMQDELKQREATVAAREVHTEARLDEVVKREKDVQQHYAVLAESDRKHQEIADAAARVMRAING